MNELRDNYEKAQRKLESADANLKKCVARLLSISFIVGLSLSLRFQSRSDRLNLANFDDRSRELEEIRNECEQARTFARDQYATETYHCASEEHAITVDVFAQYLFEQRDFYDDIAKYFSSKMPEIEERLNADEFIPLFGYDLTKHCSKRVDTLIAYPMEICVRLLDTHLAEEGLFRLASSQIKQKKFVAQLNLQSIDKGTSLSELSYDAHVPANTLKQYLRQLPDCLLTNALFTQWNQAATIKCVTFSPLSLSLTPSSLTVPNNSACNASAS